ncbi:AAA family ATPase [Undibacterium sp. CY18W]|uniref:AAA family ATPase n=1 Tax=Undibacterium hunanense TaxID=2762292 RepID=A0ABR6ZTC9_9BURK|nr:AAA family ATPase [Undibacterium hunanense]MBC3919115.1 AAA family ATPase [Undibacterium hunanense]
MLISEFHIPEIEASELGLADIHMSRLGKYVAIAGKNGSGKTRLLKKLEELIAYRDQNLFQSIAFSNSIKEIEKIIEEDKQKPNDEKWKNELVLATRAYERLHNTITLKNSSPIKSLKFVPKKLLLLDPLYMSLGELIEKYSSAQSLGIEDLSTICSAYIQQVQNLWWNATHPEFVEIEGHPSKHELTESYSRLKNLILALMEEEIQRSPAGEVMIFNKSFLNAGLSDGQIILLQLAVAIHARNGVLNDTVFVLDELENHLHPSVAIDIIEKISSAAPNAQFWIATHSIPLLAYIYSKDPSALWFMENGRICHAGRHPERVLNGLLGDDERIGQLNTFTGLPAELAATTYAVESLMPPTVAPLQKNDPQINQIATFINAKQSEGSVSILDFGAGKGRLLEGLTAQFTADEQSQISGKISYFAFDEFPADKETCQALIKEYYPDYEKRYFESEARFFEIKDNASIDIVVMCNVLHEIPPKDWLDLFSSSSSNTAPSIINRALRENGYLLLVEDQRIPVGEKAHEHGFLVLDTAELRTLFKVSEVDINNEKFIVNSQRDGRLKAHLISKELLARIDATSRNNAIAELQSYAKRQIKNIRKEPATYANGQLHGFWTQQFTNAFLYLQEN